MLSASFCMWGVPFRTYQGRPLDGPKSEKKEVHKNLFSSWCIRPPRKKNLKSYGRPCMHPLYIQVSDSKSLWKAGWIWSMRSVVMVARPRLEKACAAQALDSLERREAVAKQAIWFHDMASVVLYTAPSCGPSRDDAGARVWAVLLEAVAPVGEHSAGAGQQVSLAAAPDEADTGRDRDKCRYG